MNDTSRHAEIKATPPLDAKPADSVEIALGELIFAAYDLSYRARMVGDEERRALADLVILLTENPKGR